MRELNIGTKKYSKVVCLDEPGAGGACHSYEIMTVENAETEITTCCFVQFQNGPVKEAGVNGCHQEDLLAIVIDRLRGFQGGKYECKENSMALTHCEEALSWLRRRTNAREARNVEGTSVK